MSSSLYNTFYGGNGPINNQNNQQNNNNKNNNNNSSGNNNNNNNNNGMNNNDFNRNLPVGNYNGDDDDDNTEKKSAVGGRPRDKVWDLFDGTKDVAKCHYCPWKTDHPKAFRMRAHVANCDAIPAELKSRLESFQAAKEEKRITKDEAAEAAAAATPAKKVKRERESMAGKAAAKSPITCHVLDSTSGKPAPEMRIRLDRLNTSGFVLIAQGITDNDGRCLNLLNASNKLEEGIFKITFFSSEYFTKRGILSFYPFVEVPFEVKNADEHYHIPLLLSPYAYSTYRGS